MPHEPLERFEELLEEHDRAVGYSSVAFPTSISAVHRQITETETELELFLDERLVEWLRTDYGEVLRDALEAENATLRQLPSGRGLDVMLASFDDRVVWIGVYDDDGDVRGAITLESERAIEWARERFDRCREAGREIPPSSEVGDE
ncbi:transcriptional regulator FilR1 domain-containing protein [Halalkalicoccus salilacus]|uniref:transcriptional regulator FilR1 domain-containing protein n=1 Tax=Halalkalicoccus salilacus TaxID=3117459 RepID=UPI00300E96BD